MKIYLAFLLTIFSQVVFAQINDGNIRLKTLQKSNIGKNYVYGKWNGKGGMETHLTYLGNVKTKKGKTYKIMTSVWLWGLSRRATNKILIFNNLNQYIGEYSVTMISDLPKKLKNGILIFENKNNDCDQKVSSKINFKNGIPKEFFRECKKGSGGIYEFYSF
ncbi:hypothetical protein [Chryseobacterium indoltheticum]|uniref:DUF3108 domain-containing protein n=1 Tax=Chryseobacterium indoltheticum TaxID=254 RepID=A0A381FC17_9FLAO|nr:hypothetical protein [Chryseobacterium indoltheticum]AZA73834.1 hypothetical protein EG358_08750 [Chryseobacterium indoltheticum]SIQ96899.1 hypothetical protein SAMN05421682_110185 [Chryseobacterium indoltheticum]SUX44111.1 Uncharacterised protein [Chryseobacterium indoltheticum]